MIRNAVKQDCSVLTGLSIQSKQHWGYTRNEMLIFKEELKITTEYLNSHIVRVWEIEGMITGYSSLIYLEKEVVTPQMILEQGFWLDHLFIHPDNMGEGIGTALFRDMEKLLKTRNADHIRILSDPNAVGFYLKMGAVRVNEYPSSIAGRTTPCLSYSC